jgi:hypothetical protein
VIRFGFHGADSWFSWLLALLGAALVVGMFARMLGYEIITLGEDLSQSMIVVGVPVRHVYTDSVYFARNAANYPLRTVESGSSRPSLGK